MLLFINSKLIITKTTDDKPYIEFIHMESCSKHIPKQQGLFNSNEIFASYLAMIYCYLI